ncbi:MAG: leucine-rich repeat protein, partial [Thermoguttaceae bacterium]|nr:leucine-rich repeat protein [Thermoguttaceae bacterium]
MISTKKLFSRIFLAATFAMTTHWAFCFVAFAQSWDGKSPEYKLSVDYRVFKEYSENEGGFDSFTVPDKVRTIGAGAFQSARKLKKIVLSESVDAIEDGALDCPSLETIDVAENNSSFR